MATQLCKKDPTENLEFFSYPWNKLDFDIFYVLQKISNRLYGH